MDLINFIFHQETQTQRNLFSKTTVTKVVRGKRCIMWIRHDNYPNVEPNLSRNLRFIHPKLEIAYLRQIGTVKQETGREDGDNFSVIFEFISN